MNRYWGRALGLTLGATLLFAACGNDDDNDLDAAPPVTVGASAEPATTVESVAPVDIAPTTVEPAPTTAARTATGPGSASIIATVTSPLGPIVADRDGRAVYAFTNDHPGEAPSCVDQCATNWPPLLVNATPTAAGSIDGTQLATVTRADGALQAVYAGMPLYYFNGDSSPGQLNGQGVGGTWYAVAPAGELVTASAAKTVNVAATDIGDVAVDAKGYTLYLFKNDSKDGEPTCVDACAQNWPPAAADGALEAGADVDPALLGTVARHDGIEQVTLNGWPLYRFSGDRAPGDVNGQGVGGTWFASSPAGTFTEPSATAAPAAAAADPYGPASPPASAARAAAPTPTAVTIQNLSFGEDLEVARGTTVTWTNQDSASHTVTADDLSFDSGFSSPLKKGGTFSQTFAEPGTFAYHCEIHPSMQGVVTVR